MVNIRYFLDDFCTTAGNVGSAGSQLSLFEALVKSKTFNKHKTFSRLRSYGLYQSDVPRLADVSEGHVPPSFAHAGFLLGLFLNMEVTCSSETST
jgi:hypothetical protein